jgi:alpha-1,2-mannosyltransferase
MSLSTFSFLSNFLLTDNIIWLITLSFTVVLSIAWLFFATIKWKSRLIAGCKSSDVELVAFFHPYCNSGGGGERVLWLLIFSLLKNETLRGKIRIVIYTAHGSGRKDDIISNVKQKFYVDLNDFGHLITFVYIRSTTLLEAKWYAFT